MGSARSIPASARVGVGLLIALLVTPFAPGPAPGRVAHLARTVLRRSGPSAAHCYPTARRGGAQLPGARTAAPRDPHRAIVRDAGIGVVSRGAANRWMRWPARGVLTSPFGWRSLFMVKEFHEGIDIAAAFGAPVRAARAGTVRAVGWIGGYGRRIVLDHGQGLDTLYAHLSRTLVRSGERVRQGAVIATIGSTGRSTGPHLHFGVLRRGAAVDPIRYLR